MGLAVYISTSEAGHHWVIWRFVIFSTQSFYLIAGQLYRIWLCGTAAPEIWLAENAQRKSVQWGAVLAQYITSTFPESPRDTHGRFNNEQPVVAITKEKNY